MASFRSARLVPSLPTWLTLLRGLSKACLPCKAVQVPVTSEVFNIMNRCYIPAAWALPSSPDTAGTSGALQPQR